MLMSNLLILNDGIIHSLVNIILVFAVIAVIITGCYLASKLIDKTENKEKVKEKPESKPSNIQQKNTNITDDDMMAAVLVATIDFRNEVKEDVRLVSVREIK
jgi:Na+-transporting methylmalonyl-CoA/oxaloacetate decarboxylase gamma subunit